MSYVILVPDRTDPPGQFVLDVFGPETEVITPRALHADQVPAEAWERADAILLWHEVKLTREVIARLRRCRIVVRVGVGLDNVDLDAAREAGIPVCNIPDYGTEDVADHALALMMALQRGLVRYAAAVRSDSWSWKVAPDLQRVSGSTTGLVGLGRIGTAMAMRAKAVGSRVVFYDPYKSDGYDKALGVTRCETLEELLEQSDTVSLHLPLEESTRNIADKAFFGRMKPKSVFINTARGGLMDLDALHGALAGGRLRCAGLDVLPVEPPDWSHPLLSAWRAGEEWIADRLIITPHSAFFCEQSFEEMQRKAAHEALRVLNGKPPRNCVNGVGR